MIGPAFYKCRESAATPGGVFEPGVIYCWPGGLKPATLKTFAANGILEPLDGKPSAGIDYTTIGARWFDNPPEPLPTETLIDGNETADRLGVSLADLELLVASYGLPKPEAVRTVRSRPDTFASTSTALWRFSTVDRWRRAHPLLKARGTVQ